MSSDMTLLDILSEAEESFTCRSGMINPYVVTVDMKNNGRNLLFHLALFQYVTRKRPENLK